MTVTILADSACDLTDKQYQKYNIEMVPLTIALDKKEFKDGKDISPKQVYDAMRNGKSPKTSQVSPQSFKDIFTAYAEKKQTLIYIAFSSELSGTYQTAKMMENDVKETYPEAKLHVIDSKCASLGYGLVVLSAAKLGCDGGSAEEVIKMAAYHASHMEHIFTVDDLEYLYRGGRVSKTAAFVGSLLKIKPILHVNHGKLIPLEKIRGSKKVLSRMLQIMEKRGVDLQNQIIGISHGDDFDRAQQLADMVKDTTGCKEVIIEMVGAAIGAHSGPGTLALFFLNDIKK